MLTRGVCGFHLDSSNSKPQTVSSEMVQKNLMRFGCYETHFPFPMTAVDKGISPATPVALPIDN